MTSEMARFGWLQQQFRTITTQVAKSVNAADIAQLKKHRAEIVEEARAIVRKINVPTPNWYGKKIGRSEGYSH
jgi:hypothetical protein